MAKAAWPANEDLLKLLQAAGMMDDPLSSPQKKLDLSSALDAAVEWWERETGYKPFLADVNDSTRVFTPDATDLIDLNGGLVSFASLSIDTTVYTQGQQFYLAPANAPSMGQPYTYIDWGQGEYSWGLISQHLYGRPRVISITGKWGFATQIPGDVWNAVLRRAALEVLPQLGALRTAGVSSQSEGPVKESYGPKGAYGEQADAWETSIAQTLARYRRVRIA